MKSSSFFFAATLAVSLALPTFAQQAPAGWTTQTKAGGAKTFTPPDLKTGERYSVTIYDAAPLGGRSVEVFLRDFAGPVGTKPGQLAAPLALSSTDAFTSGTGVYRGPNETHLLASFTAFPLDGGRLMAVTRILTSHEALIARYTDSSVALMDGAMKRARAKTPSATQSDEERQNAQARREAEEAEAKLRRFSTALGKGIALAQIAQLLHHSVMRLNGMGTSISTEQYLLLRDGTVHRGMDVPPDELDIAKSRRGEPENWGKWRRKGQEFEVSWQGQTWESLEGERVEPGAAGTRLNGSFGTGSGSSGIGFSSYAFWGISFDSAGRFKTSRSGGASNGAVTAPGQASVSTQYDDNGSSASMNGPNASVFAGRKANPNGNNEGTYAINGYTLTLRYDNGRRARLPFFFGDKTRKALWFDGSYLLRSDQ